MTDFCNVFNMAIILKQLNLTIDYSIVIMKSF